MKLTQEEEEKLAELMVLEYWPIIEKLVEFPVKKMEETLLSYNMDQGIDGLVQRKHQATGAKAVSIFIQTLKRQQKKKEKKDGG